MGRGNENLVYLSLWDFKRSGFTSHLKEDVLQIFITLKNPWPGSNPRPLGLTTTTPRRLIHDVVMVLMKLCNVEYGMRFH
jgi:hypothetical protein